MSTPRLPHRYPFLVLDRVVDARAEFCLGAGAARLRGAPHDALTLPASLLIECMAQGAMALLQSAEAEAEAAGGPRGGMLAAIDEATFDHGLARRPIAAGDRVQISCEVEIRLGRLLKVRTTAARDGEPVARARMTLAAD